MVVMLPDELGLQDLAITYATLGDGRVASLLVSEAQVECGGQLLGVDVYIVERSEEGKRCRAALARGGPPCWA